MKIELIIDLTDERIYKKFSELMDAIHLSESEHIDHNHPINDLEFTVRTNNCLHAEGIETIGDLLKWSALRLLATPNLGRKSLREIEEKLKNHGLRLEHHG